MANLTADPVTEFRVEPAPSGEPGRAHLVLKCQRTPAGECRFGLWQKPAAGITWQWDGNMEKPTITPSIACNGGCGRHFTMIVGEPR